MLKVVCNVILLLLALCPFLVFVVFFKIIINKKRRFSKLGVQV